MSWAKEHRTIVIGCSVALLLCESLIIGIGDVTQHRVIGEIGNDRPASDHPDEALKFRRLQLQDEHGYIPLDGLQKAKEHVERMKAAQQKRLKVQTKTGTPKGLPPKAADNQPNSWTLLEPGDAG